MADLIKNTYSIEGNDLTKAGEASSNVKKLLKQLGVSPLVVKKVAISMYEMEINAVIHAGGGDIVVEIDPKKIKIIISDNGPGIENIELAMTEGYSTASEEIKKMGFGAGMGLPNAKRNSDFFEVESKLGVGTKITIVVNFG